MRQLAPSHLEAKLFFDGTVDIARYDKVKYPIFDGFTTQQLSYFWQPEEVDIFRDAKDFKGLTPAEQFIFTSVLFRQIKLDSEQGRSPVLAFGPIVSLPEMETWLSTWQFSENIHSRSYTHIIRNVYPDPTKVFDQINDIPVLTELGQEISKYYDELMLHNVKREAARNGFKVEYDEFEHKKSFWRAVIAVNALEGIRFYASFACSWAFAETKRMEGNAKIIKLIARDEALHLGSTQQLVKILPKDDPDFTIIRDELYDESIEIMKKTVEQEVDWARYIMQHGSMLGLSEEILIEYVNWIGNRRMQGIGLPQIFDAGKTNPLPWTQKWISGQDVQQAPQEVAVISYVTGSIEQDITPEFLKTLRI